MIVPAILRHSKEDVVDMNKYSRVAFAELTVMWFSVHLVISCRETIKSACNFFYSFIGNVCVLWENRLCPAVGNRIK